MNDFYLASYDDPIPHSDELTFDAVIAVPSSTEEGSRPKDKPRPERVTTELRWIRSTNQLPDNRLIAT